MGMYFSNNKILFKQKDDILLYKPQIENYAGNIMTVKNEWKRRNNRKKNSAEGRERATVHSVLECETVATFLHFTSI